MTVRSLDFDALTMPLDGIRLIEASAGTGKTFSLAGLYLRLLLEEQVSVREILVVTFTRAATRELRERIRQRLASAAAIARDSASAEPGRSEDQYVEMLIANSKRTREQAIRCWTDAARRMDEATIATIHGFSQRAAAENAFDSAVAFDRGDQVDDRAVYDEATEDYWRARALGSHAQPGFTEWWETPDKLTGSLAPLWMKPHARLAGPDHDQILRIAKRARVKWGKGGDTFRKELLDCWHADELKKTASLYCEIDKRGGPDQALAELALTLESDAPIPAIPDWVQYLGNPEAAFKKRYLKTSQALFKLPLTPCLVELTSLARLAALREAHDTVHQTATARKRARRQFSFADMIETLHSAITRKGSGARLANALWQTWPWALIDEFQDTDPRQYEILHRIYADRNRGGLVLIGDPKQAIYGFRGGDVFAYLRASRDAGTRYRLSANFRSTPGLLDAISHLFRSPGSNPFLFERISFQSPTAGRKEKRELVFHDAVVAPMTVWHMQPDSGHAGRAREICLETCVTQIGRFLHPANGAMVREQLSETGQIREHPLRPRDIAVLVNTNQQASDAQRALSRIGIPAVCLHEESVFNTEEARDLQRILEAASNPMDEGTVRGALVGTLLGCRLNQMIALHEDETRWHSEIERFQQHNQRWRDDGILAMIEPLVQDGASRLLTYEDGARRLSNYLQLAELLARAETETFGMTGLLRWLQTKTRKGFPDQRTEAEQLRLESDEALVRIATVHKAKGLEYPLVFLPFAPWLGATAKADQLPFELHDVHDQALLDVVGESGSKGAAIREKRSEALRTFYVAITRAELGCFFPWGAANGTPNSALASLLHREDGIGPESWINNRNLAGLTNDLTRKRLKELADRASGTIVIQAMKPVDGTSTRLPPAPVTPGAARTDLPTPRTPWSITSFTGLAHSAQSGPVAAGAADEAAAALQEEAAMHPVGPVAELPGGTAFGTAIHALLETTDLAHWPSPGEPKAETQLRRIGGVLRQHGVSIPDGPQGTLILEQTHQLICHTVHTTLPDIGPLFAIPQSQRMPEMEFMLRLGGATVEDMLALLAQAGYLIEMPRNRHAQLLNGLMHGFVDLVVESAGRFYVIDYKTNWLGPDFADYTQAALQKSVRRHHYTLQYLVYLTALHGYLSQRLPDYDPEQRLGGAYYLFVRGMRGDTAQSGIYFDRPSPDLIRRLAKLLGSENKTL